MKLVVVTWNDAHQSGAEPFDEDTFHKPHVTTSVGYVVRNDKVGISLAGCIDAENAFDRALFIPAGMVVKMKVLHG